MNTITGQSLMMPASVVRSHGTSKRSLRIRLYLALVGNDVVCILSAFVAAALIRFGHLDVFGGPGVTACVLTLFLLCAVSSGAYSMDVLVRPSIGIARAFASLISAFGLLLLLSYFLKADAHFSRIITAITFIVSTISIATTRLVGGDWIHERFNGEFTSQIMLCDDVTMEAPAGCRVIHAADIALRPDPRNADMLITFANLLEGADRVIVACSQSALTSWATMLKGAKIQGEILVREFDLVDASGIGRIDGRTTVVVSRGPLHIRQRVAKRVFDLAIAVPAIMLLLPLFAVIALVIMLDSPGPPLFKQRRVGHGNELFQIFKFRTMAQALSDAEGHQSVARDDMRITRAGRILRRTSIDELPQLLNVLFGSMSIVGPRPHALGSLAGEELFWRIDDSYSHRHVLKPGITGLAQIRGFRGATYTRDDLKSRLSSDLEYVRNWSLWRDMLIVLQTARVMVHPNAY